jgi:hypothetical protein
MIAEPLERIIQSPVHYGAPILICKERCGIAAIMLPLPAIVAVLCEHAA